MIFVTSLRTFFLLWFVLHLSACSTVVSDSSVAYEKATSLPPLEIPPDLVTPTVDDEMAIPNARPNAPTRYSDYAGNATSGYRAPATTVLPFQDDIRVMRSGNQRWLVIHANPDQVWGKVHDFWLNQGFLIKKEDAKAGILETDWLENRANIPQSGIRAIFGKVVDKLYDSSTRDRFRVRLERDETPDNTEVYISHMGVEEVVKGEGTVWQMRPNDPELEAVMLQRLMVFMGLKEDKAKTMLAMDEPRGDRTRLVTEEENLSLVIDENFAQAWRHVGLALDQVGFTVEDRDRSNGIYYVRYNDPDQNNKEGKSFLSKLAFWQSDDTHEANEQFRIHLQGHDEHTEVVVKNKSETRDTSPTGRRILTLLHERLR